MLKIRDLGINIEYRLGYQGTYGDMGPGSISCPDMSCIDVYKKRPSKKPSKKAPSKKSPAKTPSKKSPSKKGYRANGFGSAAVAQLGRQLEEQLRDVQ